MDTFEMTVGRFRALHLPDGVAPPVTYSTTDTQNTWRPYCTLGSPAANADDLPLNCVTRETAAAICAQLGKRLPTDAELQLASSGGTNRNFPWGARAPEYASPSNPDVAVPCCAGVVFGRQADTLVQTAVTFDACSSKTNPPPEGSYAVGPEAVDGILGRTPTGACAGIVDVSVDGVVGLGGNVSEWTSDDWARAEDPCWTSTAPHQDPLCAPPLAVAPIYSVYFAGSWVSPVGYQSGIYRYAAGTGQVLQEATGTGLRCVRDAKGGT
jgi:formylglycine-generating enzyme required for sulfatase activity